MLAPPTVDAIAGPLENIPATKEMQLLRLVIGLGALAFATTAEGSWENHAPPAARPAFCANFKAKVFFMTNRASLSDQAAKDIVSLLAKTIATCRPVKVVIAGFIDRSETLSVARERAETVKRELVARGVATAVLEVAATGPADFAMPPPSVRNRRAEMTMYFR